MKKVLLLTDKPFAQVAIDGIQKVVPMLVMNSNCVKSMAQIWTVSRE